MINFINLILSSLAVFIPAFASSRFNVNSDWYNSLIKPNLQPPPITFGIVWPILYLLLIASIYKLSNSNPPTYLWFIIAIGILLNFMWTWAFFSNHNARMAFSIILIYLLILTIQYFVSYKTDPVAANLLLPLIIWIIFATYLNYEIISINNL